MAAARLRRQRSRPAVRAEPSRSPSKAPRVPEARSVLLVPRPGPSTFQHPSRRRAAAPGPGARGSWPPYPALPLAAASEAASEATEGGNEVTGSAGRESGWRPLRVSSGAVSTCSWQVRCVASRPRPARHGTATALPKQLGELRLPSLGGPTRRRRGLGRVLGAGCGSPLGDDVINQMDATGTFTGRVGRRGRTCPPVDT